MPGYIQCWHGHPSGIGTLERYNDLHTCMASENKVRCLPGVCCLLSHDSCLLMSGVNSIGLLGAAISVAISSKSDCPSKDTTSIIL